MSANAKRNPVLDRLAFAGRDEVITPAPAPAPAGHVTPPDEPQAVEPAPTSARRGRPIKTDKEARQHTSIYLPVKAHDRIREVAFLRKVNLNVVLIEAVNAWLKANGHSDAIK